MPISLAFLDLVPVALTAAGLALLVRALGAGLTGQGGGDPRWLALGASLVVAGGAAKAIWKLIVALGGPDLPVLYAALYPGLALGYLLLAAATIGSAPGRLTRRPWIPVLVALTVLLPLTLAVGPAGGRLVPLAWLVTGGLASVVLDLGLARRAVADGLPRAGACFAIHALAVLGLQALGRPNDQSVALQWVQEGLNTVTQAVFLVGAAALVRATRSTVSARADAAR